MTAFAVVLRLNNRRIGSDRSLSRSHRFSTREIGLWTASLAVFLAITETLATSFRLSIVSLFRA